MTPLLAGLLKSGLSLIDDFFESGEEKAAAAFRLQELAQKGNLAELQAEVTLLTSQTKVNAVEAAHKSIFVAGWRPFVGWVCASSLAYVSIIEPLMRFVAMMCGYTGEFPAIDVLITGQVLTGMLGIAGMRSYDKFKNTQTDSIN